MVDWLYAFETVDWLHTLGVIGGIVALVTFGINVSKFYVDRSRISVQLIWYSEFRPVKTGEDIKYWAHAVVRNKGRRPIYITHLFIDEPNNPLSMDELSQLGDDIGRRIGEGDKPLIIKVSHERFAGLSQKELMKVRAVAEDSRGETI